ncbi:MAG: M13 family metallopeptidase [Bacteroidales bacterium]|nr:M13 family metallopeptidase [Bacteroidales bacterium]
MKRIIMASAIAAMTLSGCNQVKEAGKPAIDLANFDNTVSPAEDFYQYACGGWMAANPLTPEYARYGIFDQLDKENQEKLKALIEELNSKPQEEGSVGDKISTLYALGLDMEKRNADGAAPVKEQLAAIDAITDIDGLSAVAARMHMETSSPFFSFYIGADEKNSTMNLLQFNQGGLSMGDRDYYLLQDENSVKIRNAYREYVNTLFTLAGYSEADAAKAADAVLRFETGIAETSVDRNALRDVHKNYNKMSLKEFVRKYDFLNWDIFFKEVGIRNSTELNAGQLPFFKGLTKLMKKTSIEDLKAYLSFKLLNSASNYLSEDFVNANFEFFGKTVQGREELQPLWKRSLSVVNRSLAEAFGQMYVEKYFPASSKEKMLEMVANLQTALGERIEALEWMSDETKAKAQEKLGTFIVKVGYPDTWKDYTALEIKEDSYWANICRANVFSHNEMMKDEGKPVDRTQWGMSPQTVNAYYNPTTNEICFPAAILQPPFFNPDADDAVNYGGIGVVIGHEMTHGFDDQGRNYDKDGNLSAWWTKEDEEKFNEKAQVLVDQYDRIVVLDTLHADGRYTLGENIADQGGLLISYQAYMNTLEGKERPADIDGFTHEQRFYLGYANLWAQNVRPQEIIRRTKTDVHSLGKWRVNGALRNIDGFYEAFGIKEGDAMYMAPEERINIW